MPEDIQSWATRTIERYDGVTADPRNLAKFVGALVEKHTSTSSLKATCRKQLTEFLGDSTESFISSLVRHLDKPNHESSSSSSRNKDERDDESPQVGRKRRSRDYRDDDEEDRPTKVRREHHQYEDRDYRSRNHRDYREDIGDDPNPGLEDWSSESDSRAGSSRSSSNKRDYRNKGRNYRKGYDRDNNRRSSRGNNKDSNTLCVRNIPKENNNITSLNEHFSQFGTIVNIDVKYSQNMALVKFTHHNSAYKAYKSPEPIFGNRFIKLSFSNDNDSSTSELSQSSENVPKVPQNVVPQNMPPQNIPRNFSIVNTTSPSHNPLILQKQKEELRKKQMEQQQKLLKLLATPNLDAETKATLFKQLKDLTTSMEESLKKESTLLQQQIPKPKKPTKEDLDKELDTITQNEGDSTSELESKLDSLKQKADELIASGPIRGRGGFRGTRGRGRGGFTRGPLKIDNRTCLIKIEDPPSELLNEENLTSFFKKFGSIEDIHIDETSAVVQFSKRKQAEYAMRTATTYEDKPLKLSWKEKEPEQMDPPPTHEENEQSKDAVGLSSDEEDSYWNQ